MKLDKGRYFGPEDKSRIPMLIQYQSIMDEKISLMHDYEHPLVNGTYSIDINNYLKSHTLNNEPMDPEDVLEYMAYYFENLPDWNFPGAMINVIPAVNIVSAAVSNVAEIFNPNCAQDTYSGNLLLAELEVIKYMSEQIGWDWNKSTGIFTFGGTGTNMYGTKLALLNADGETAKKGAKGAYFSITSKNGHPCHYQLCDWLGLGSDTCIEVGCTSTGEMDVKEAERVIHINLREGKTFLGFNLTGGSTNEMQIDTIKEIYNLRDRITIEYNLDYKPLIHVDSVLGWVYLFFKEYDFDKNPKEYTASVLKTLKSLYKKADQFKYADTIGIDFHKTGFCPYVTSLFMVKDKSLYFKLNPQKSYELRDMKYGDYNPFYTSLEYSRSCKGPIAALSCLKSLGKNSFCDLIGDLVTSALHFRALLNQDPRICIIEPDSEGFATIFSLIPENLEIKDLGELKNCTEDEINCIRKLNLAFGKKILYDCVHHNKKFIFTASRSYTLPGTEVKVGALKAYPMSIYFSKNEAENIAQQIRKSITELYNMMSYSDKYSSYDLFQDMSKE